ncbi:hypothetical protein FKM82_030090 [Ascaphus truei]
MQDTCTPLPHYRQRRGERGSTGGIKCEHRENGKERRSQLGGERKGEHEREGREGGRGRTQEGHVQFEENGGAERLGREQ